MASSSYDNLGDAVRDLDDAQKLSGEAARNKMLDQINAAVLIDIAMSLRIIAESAAAPGAIIDEHGDEHVGEIPASIDDAPLEVGDRVAPAEDEGGSPDDDEPVGVIESIGITEGTEFATVVWDTGSITRVWLSQLRRVADADEPDTPAPPAEPEGGIDDPEAADWGNTPNPFGEGAAQPADAFAALSGKGKKKNKSKGNG